MILDIIKYPDAKLAQKSQKAVAGKNLDQLVKNMLDTINAFKDPEAAGLSAIQVGVPVRVLIARDFVSHGEAAGYGRVPQRFEEWAVRSGTRNENAVDYILVNPKFVSFSKEEELDWEGCLSFPDLYGKVWRSKKVKLKYQNMRGEEQRLTATNFLARVIQHEVDHLDGITFNTKVVGKMYKGDELEKENKMLD